MSPDGLQILGKRDGEEGVDGVRQRWGEVVERYRVEDG
jgi:hypothetical protein